jgi:hypothetical protein
VLVLHSWPWSPLNSAHRWAPNRWTNGAQNSLEAVTVVTIGYPQPWKKVELGRANGSAATNSNWVGANKPFLGVFTKRYEAIEEEKTILLRAHSWPEPTPGGFRWLWINMLYSEKWSFAQNSEAGKQSMVLLVSESILGPSSRTGPSGPLLFWSHLPWSQKDAK